MPRLRVVSRFVTLATLALVLTNCGGSKGRGAASSTSAAVCAKDLLSHGGTLLKMPDGVSVWYKLQGRENAPIVAYLHGGPGYNSYAFEQSAGKLLEQSFRVLYIDQRGCGRSGFEGADSEYGMRKTVDDIEHIRAAIGVQKVALVGHSFGGLVAAEYTRRFPERVTQVIMVDTTPFVERAFEAQIAFADSIGPKAFSGSADEIHALAKRKGGAFGRLRQIYSLAGRKALQERMHFASSSKQNDMEALDDESGILACTSSHVAAILESEGYLSDMPGLAVPLDRPTLLVAGRESHVIGQENIEAAVKTWGAELVVVKDAGHFVYFEQPLEFAEIVTAWLHGTPVHPRR